MSQIDQAEQQHQLIESAQSFSEAENHEQKSHDNPIIYVESSDDFINVDASLSQYISACFNTLPQSQDLSASHQIQTENKRSQQKVQGQIQQSATQIVEPEAQPQSKPEHPTQQLSKQQKSDTKPTVDYESMVSLKIFEKKINESLQLKNQGNEFYKANQYQQAIQKYSQGLAVLDPQQFYGATQAQCQKMAEVSASLLYNIGMCFFNSNSWKQAEVYFNETIMINANHIKALHRRALTRYHLQKYEQAMNDIKQAFHKDRRNAQVHESYQKILAKYNEQLKKQKESMKEISSKIFRKQSQNSAAVSPQKQEEKQEKKVEVEQQEKEKDENSGDEETSLWDLVPLVLVAGAALFYGYKKFSGK